MDTDNHIGACTGRDIFRFEASILRKGKIMVFKRGQVPWNKGKSLSGEERQKVSQWMIEWWQCHPHSKGMLGKHHTEKTKRRISEKMKGNKYSLGVCPSEETRKKISESNKGKRHTEEWKQQASERVKDNKNPMFGMFGIKNPFFGKQHTEETKRIISEFNKGNKYALGVKRSPETRRKLSEHKKIFLMKHPEKHVNLLRKVSCISKPQKKIFERVITVFSDARIHYLVKTNFTIRFVDVAILSKKICIEYDGKYWHQNRKTEDEARDKELAEVGWETIRIPEGEESKIDEVLKGLQERFA